MLNHNSAKCGSHMQCGSGDTMFLVAKEHGSKAHGISYK